MRKMRNGRKAVISGFLVSMAVMSLGGCGKEEEVWNPIENNQIKIALIGSSEYIGQDILNGIETAKETVKKDYGHDLVVDVLDDEGDYKQGVTMATKVAEDSSYVAALSEQDFDIIDSVAGIFEQEEKPLIVMGGCYDNINEKEYEYLLTDFLSAEVMGKMLGNYAVKQGYKSIAYCHTNTRFELDELNGVQQAVNNSDTQISITQLVSDTPENMTASFQNWDLLDVDALCVSVYDLQFCGNLVSVLRQSGSDIPVLTDYSINNEETIQTNGSYMDGIICAPLYPYNVSQELKLFEEAFQEKYGHTPSSNAVQYYDMICMLVQRLENGINSSGELMEAMKNGDVYKGISSDLKFDKNGRLAAENVQVLEFRNGEFLPIDEGQ
ncbi:MAG: ABC transporter substrate-binding protein [Eubacteriales bacterium]|nr:ABC transporter substrate-binding protein [Eubacteriales bacterium]